MTSLVYSQNGYPKKIVLENKDTVIAITTTQMGNILTQQIACDKVVEQLAASTALLDSVGSSFMLHRVIVGNYEDQIDLMHLQIAERDLTITKADIHITQDARYIKKLKRERTLIGAAGLAVATFLSYLLIAR